MGKIYISGKISGTKDYMGRFAAAERHLKAVTNEAVVNPARVNAQLPKEGTSYDDYMTISLIMLSLCDSIYMTYGWWESNGARMELTLARMKKLHIVFEHWPRRTWRNGFTLWRMKKRRAAARREVLALCTNGKRLIEIVSEQAVTHGRSEEEVLKEISAAAAQGVTFTTCADLKQIEDRILQYRKDVSTRTFKRLYEKTNEAKSSVILGEDGLKAIAAKEARENGTGN